MRTALDYYLKDTVHAVVGQTVVDFAADNNITVAETSLNLPPGAASSGSSPYYYSRGDDADVPTGAESSAVVPRKPETRSQS